MTREAWGVTLGRVESRRERRWLAVLLLVALGLRVGWSVSRPTELDRVLGDQREYLELGRNLLGGRGLQFYDERFGQTVYAYRTPGYPAFVALCGGNVTVVRVVQGLLDTSSVLAVYLIARRFLDRRTSLMAGAIVALNPFLAYFTGLILSETLFTAMLVWGLYLLLRWPRAPFGGLLLLSLTILVRPSSLGLVLILAAAIGWPGGWRRVVWDLGIAGMLIVAILLPWAYRNAHHPSVRYWVWTTTNSGITTYDGFHDRATGASDQKQFLDELKPLLIRMDEVERDAWLGQRAHEWIRAHPSRSFQLMLIKIARTWSPVPLSSEYGGSRLYVAVGLTYTLPLYVLILLGLSKPGIPRSAKVFLLIPAIYFTAIHALSVGSLRYRVPVEPPMAVIAAGGVASLLSKLNGPSRRES
jgi:4-amino-4-deoxy-L-arabinose transferase-like glycosyltransferase